MGLIQEVQTLKKENNYNAEKIKKQIERLERQLEKAKQEKEYKKDQFTAIENEAKDLFKQEFNKLINADLQKYEKDIILKYNKLKTLNEKDKYIQMLSTTDLEGHFIEDNYYKILDKVYSSYLSDLKAKQNIKQEMLKSNPLSTSDWDSILSQNLITGINQFEKMTGTKWGQSNNNTTKKIKKNSFIAFLNMILK